VGLEFGMVLWLFHWSAWWEVRVDKLSNCITNRTVSIGTHTEGEDGDMAA